MEQITKHNQTRLLASFRLEMEMVLRSETYLECTAAVKFRATGMATSKFYWYDT